ncbi:hypothetical protein pclt_cds_1 [Pandoravirus celtis]|nr:hypothetical protein pclt_cds_1 [Pandoravirus celtis]
MADLEDCLARAVIGYRQRSREEIFRANPASAAAMVRWDADLRLCTRSDYTMSTTNPVDSVIDAVCDCMRYALDRLPSVGGRSSYGIALSAIKRNRDDWVTSVQPESCDTDSGRVLPARSHDPAIDPTSGRSVADPPTEPEERCRWRARRLVERSMDALGLLHDPLVVMVALKEVAMYMNSAAGGEDPREW